MIRKLLALSLFLLTICCAHKRIGSKPDLTPADMLDSVVRIEVNLEQVVLDREEKGKGKHKRVQIVEHPRPQAWIGSGFVYAKGEGKSFIVSASHVLATPKVGEVVAEPVLFFGTEISRVSVRTESVKITATTNTGKVCNVKVLKLGGAGTDDVATAELDCDAGRVAQVASVTPKRGSRVIMIGFPTGVAVPVITEGFVAGWNDGYLVTSSPAFPGNSGGPVFYNGQVIGVLCRVTTSYHHITHVSPLVEVLKRIAETK